ncbi:MAG: hypothetical protein ACLTAI_06055 [Thomasclavelia sp.]
MVILGKAALEGFKACRGNTYHRCFIHVDGVSAIQQANKWSVQNWKEC